MRDGRFLSARAESIYLTYDSYWKSTISGSLAVKDGSTHNTRVVSGTFGYGPDALTGVISPCDELYPKHEPWTFEKVISMHNEELSFLNLSTP